MDERLIIFINELKKHTEEYNEDEFIFSVEYWGILWMPWFIYIRDEWVKFSISELNSEDFAYLIKLGIIELIKEYSGEEINDPIEISREKYKLIKYSK